MKNQLVISAFFLCLSTIASARKWTDTQGRTIEAEIVRADADSVTVLTGGREVKIPRSKLSEEDQEYCDEWLENDGKVAEDNTDPKDGDAVPPKEGPAKGELVFDGKPLVTGGKVNVFSYDYSAEALAAVKKNLKPGETGFRIGIAVPAGFDPAKPQRVFIANTAQNNAQQTAQGNTAMAGFFAKQCVERGWICIAFDSNLGRPTHNQDLISGVAKMNEVWPQFGKWKLASSSTTGSIRSIIRSSSRL